MFNWLNASCLRLCSFFGFELTRCIRQIDCAIDECGDTRVRAAARNAHTHLRVLSLVLLGVRERQIDDRI